MDATASHQRRVNIEKARAAKAIAVSQQGRLARERQPASHAKPIAAIASPPANCPQNGASSHGGRTLPSGLLQPPGRSSSAVTSVPTRGHPTKKRSNAPPSGIVHQRWTKIAPARPKQTQPAKTSHATRSPPLM